jgi:hypothetical protein
MRIAYNNFIDALSSASILASSEDSSYPVTNTQDQRLTTKWYSEDATTHTVVIDLGATTSCSIFAIMSHNLSTGGTVVVNGNDDILPNLVWTTSGQSSTQTITYNADMLLLFVTPIANRYWQFTFSGQSQNGIQIGRLWIGDYIDISPSSLDDFTVTKKRDDIVVYGKNRQKYASIGNTWRQIELTFPRTKPSSLSAIYTFYDTVGKHSSFIFANFDTLRGYELVEPMYCSIADDMGFSHARNQFYTYSLTLEEDR